MTVADNFRSGLVIAALVLAGSHGVAQSRSLPRSPSMALRESLRIEAIEDGVRFSGWDYIATVKSGGLTFVPMLGAAAPTTQHLAFEPVQYGRESFAVDVPEARPGHRDREVCLRRGGGVTERFAASGAGIALSWRFDEQPSGQGDLVVKYRVRTSLQLSRDHGDGLRWWLPGVGGVHVGGVTGIAADGQRVGGSLAMAGELLELRLPAEFVASARYPLVLDPLISTEYAATLTSANESAPDLAYDYGSDTWILVYRRVVSAVSMFIAAQRLHSDGTPNGGWISLSGNSVNVGAPKVASVNARGCYVATWQEANSVFGPFAIRCIAIDGATGAPSAAVTLNPTTVGSAVHPDVAGDRSTTGTAALIVYERENAGVRLSRVTVAGGGAAPVVASTVSVSTNPTAIRPTISKSNSERAYAIAWNEVNGIARQIRTRICSRAGTLLGLSDLVVDSSVLIVTAPGRVDIDGSGTRFVVAWERGDPGGNNGERDLWCRPLNWASFPGQLTAAGNAVAVDVLPGIDARDPAVGYCRDKYLVLYARQVFPGTSNYDVRGVELAADCSTCGEPFLLTGLNGSALRNVETTPAVASTYGGGDDDGDEAILVFHEADDAPPFTGSIVGQRYEALGGVPPAFAGSDCGTPGTIQAGNGPFAVGNTGFAVELAGVPVGGVPILMFAFPGGEQSCGTCSVVNSLSNVFVPAVGGTASYPWNLPCSTAPFVGTVFQVQWVVFGSGASPCPLGPGASFTRRMTLTLDF